jgi:iron(III) transport system permease protein
MSWLLSRKDYTTISGKSTRPNMVELGKFKHLAFAIVAGLCFHSRYPADWFRGHDFVHQEYE